MLWLRLGGSGNWAMTFPKIDLSSPCCHWRTCKCPRLVSWGRQVHKDDLQVWHDTSCVFDPFGSNFRPGLEKVLRYGKWNMQKRNSFLMDCIGWRRKWIEFQHGACEAEVCKGLSQAYIACTCFNACIQLAFFRTRGGQERAWFSPVAHNPNPMNPLLPTSLNQ